MEIIVAAAGIAGIVAALIAVPAFMSFQSDKRQKDIRELFIRTRRSLVDTYGDLICAALQIKPEWQARSDLRILTMKDWLPCKAIPLQEVRLELDSSLKGCGIKEAKSHWSAGWPNDRNGSKLESYHSAVKEFDAPALWWDSIGYRLWDIKGSRDQPTLAFTTGSYFDAFDTQEVRGFEIARRLTAGQSINELFSRSDEPFDFTNRCADVAITSLTLIEEASSAKFLMHLRDATKVATAGNTWHATPTGEFEPTGISPAAIRSGFNPWQNIMREYAEEFLGIEEYKGGTGRIINYNKEPPFRKLNAGLRKGRIRPWYLGIGLHPLTWKPEILTAVIFESYTFWDLFPDLQAKLDDPEGRKVIDLFDFDHIQAFLDMDNLHPFGQALLQRTWELRHQLLPRIY